MRYYITVGITLVMSALLQNSILNIFTLWGVSINLPLCFFMMLTFIFPDEKVVIIWGVFVGIVSDISVGLGFGVRSLAYLAVAAAILIFKELFNNESKISVVVASSIGTILYNGITYFTSTGLYGTYSFLRFAKVTGIAILLNGISVMIVYLILRKIYKNRPRMSRYERYEII